MLGHEPITLEPGFSPIEMEQYNPTLEEVETLNQQIEDFLPDEWRYDTDQSIFSRYGIDTRRRQRFSGPRISIKPSENGHKGHTIFVKMGNKAIDYFRRENGELSVTNVYFFKDDADMWYNWCRNTISGSLRAAQGKGLLGWEIL